MVRVVLLFGVSGLFGCSPTPSPCAVSLKVETLDAQSAVVELREGDALEMHAGPQGGHHVFAGLAVTGIDRVGTATLMLENASGPLTSMRTLDLATTRLEDLTCGWRRSGDALFFDAFDVTPFRGQSAKLRVSLTGTNAEQPPNVVAPRGSDQVVVRSVSLR